MVSKFNITNYPILQSLSINYYRLNQYTYSIKILSDLIILFIYNIMIMTLTIKLSEITC